MLNQADIFSTKEVADWLTIPRRKVLLYVEQGLVVPSVPPGGRGPSTRFQVPEDVMQVAIVRHLELVGIAPRYNRQIMEEYRLTKDTERRIGKEDYYDFLKVAISDQGCEIEWVNLQWRFRRTGEHFTDEQHQATEKCIEDLKKVPVSVVVNLQPINEIVNELLILQARKLGFE